MPVLTANLDETTQKDAGNGTAIKAGSKGVGEGDSMRIPLKSLEREVPHGVPKVDL